MMTRFATRSRPPIRVLKDPDPDPDPGLRRVAASALGTMSSTVPGPRGPQAGPSPTLPGGKIKTLGASTRVSASARSIVSR